MSIKRAIGLTLSTAAAALPASATHVESKPVTSGIRVEAEAGCEADADAIRQGLGRGVLSVGNPVVIHDSEHLIYKVARPIVAGRCVAYVVPSAFNQEGKPQPIAPLVVVRRTPDGYVAEPKTEHFSLVDGDPTAKSDANAPHLQGDSGDDIGLITPETV